MAKLGSEMPLGVTEYADYDSDIVLTLRRHRDDENLPRDKSLDLQ